MVHEHHKVAQVGPADEIDHAFEPRMPVPGLAALGKLQAALKVIDHRLKTGRIPPLGREVILAAGNHDPKAFFQAQLGKRQRARLLFRRKMNVAGELREGNRYTQSLLKELGIAVQKMVGPRIRLMDERIMALDRLYARLAVQPRDVGIMLP
jgi:hypothetical protein